MNPLTRWLQDQPEEDALPWGDVITACILVQLVTLSGLIFSAFSFCSRKNFAETSPLVRRLQQMAIPSFASGALLATSAFLLLPESLNLLQVVHLASTEAAEHDHLRRYLEEQEVHSEEEEGSQAWKFGAAFIGGFLFPILLGAIFEPPDRTTCENCQRLEMEAQEKERLVAAERAKAEDQMETANSADDTDTVRCSLERTNSNLETLDLNCEEGTCCHNHGKDDKPSTDIVVKSLDDVVLEAKETPSQTPKPPAQNLSLACSILIGDAFHNFTDGIFIGNAFLLCSRSLGYTIIVTTIYHELAQELADYALLVHHCGLNKWTALAANFASGFSVLIGALLILALDLSKEGMGVVLAISAGVYVFIAASECIPRVQANRKDSRDTLLFLFFFAVGAVPIGLVLLNHKHCEAVAL